MFRRLVLTLAVALLLGCIGGAVLMASTDTPTVPDVDWGGSGNPHYVGDPVIRTISDTLEWAVNDYYIEFKPDEAFPRDARSFYTSTLNGVFVPCVFHASFRCEYGALLEGSQVIFSYQTVAAVEPGEYLFEGWVEWHRSFDGVRGDQYSGSPIIVKDTPIDAIVESQYLEQTADGSCYYHIDFVLQPRQFDLEVAIASLFEEGEVVEYLQLVIPSSEVLDGYGISQPVSCATLSAKYYLDPTRAVEETDETNNSGEAFWTVSPKFFIRLPLINR